MRLSIHPMPKVKELHFIEFMLSVIEEALLSVIPENFEKSMMPTSGKENRWNILEKYLKKRRLFITVMCNSCWKSLQQQQIEF